MELTVAKIGRAHGLRGEVGLEVRTDSPEIRFAVGQQLQTRPASSGPLTIIRHRSLDGRWFVMFEQSQDRSAAEALRGVELIVEADASDEPDAWYAHELTGLRAELTDGTAVGEVIGLDPGAAHDLLVLRETGGERTLVPFVTVFVPVVDVQGGRVVLDPPGGLLARDKDNLEISDETSGT